jgi:hypothetical protein
MPSHSALERERQRSLHACAIADEAVFWLADPGGTFFRHAVDRCVSAEQRTGVAAGRAVGGIRLAEPP